MDVLFDSGRTLLFSNDGYYGPEFTGDRLKVVGRIAPKIKKHKYAYEKHGRLYTTGLMSAEAAKTFFTIELDIKAHTLLPWTECEVEDA